MTRTRFRLLMVFAVGALTLGALARHAAPAVAEDGDDVTTAMMEARVVKPATARAEPVATAAVVASFGVDETIYVVAHVTDKDGMTWYQVAMLDAVPIGWLPASEVSLVSAGETD
jgi:hypothetical protein